MEKVVTTQHLLVGGEVVDRTVSVYLLSPRYLTVLVTAKHQLTNYLYRHAVVLSAIHPDLCSAYASTHQFCPHSDNHGKPLCINVVQLTIPSLPASVRSLFFSFLFLCFQLHQLHKNKMIPRRNRMHSDIHSYHVPVNPTAQLGLHISIRLLSDRHDIRPP